MAIALSCMAVPVPAEESTNGSALYQQNCAACHGAALEGQPDWRRRDKSGRLPPPPHDATGHTWHHNNEVLFRITRDGMSAFVDGGYESNMQGFGDTLSDAQIHSILDHIKSSWPERERLYQQEISGRD